MVAELTINTWVSPGALGGTTEVSVTVRAPDRGGVEAISGLFEQAAAECALPPPPKRRPPPPTIFIGHGGSPLWWQLKNHLQDKQKYVVEAYETGARAGHAIRDILEKLLVASSFAILVMTGEDQTADGTMRARQNVIHEAGLFQGKLGFHRAIVLLEDGTEDFSNLQGIETIRFGKGKIVETFGEVVATIRREFPSAA
jgi:predicted nucleotide-binding protein